jgi:hypothetical protein
MQDSRKLPSTRACLEAACMTVDKTHVAVSDYEGGVVSIVVKLPTSPFVEQAAKRLERELIDAAKKATRHKPLIVRLHA